MKTVAKEPEPKVTVFRLFECLVRLEEAAGQLNRVGIFPGPESKAEEFKGKVRTAQATVTSLLKDYQAAWGEMQKQS